MSDGQRLRDGRYAIVGTLGEGGQGTTFDGVDVLKGQPVAIKRFAVKGAASWKDVELAEREANVLEQLSHPSLPAHVDHFEEGGSLYLVMEKIEGEPLAKLVKRSGALSREDVVRFLTDVSGVLDYLHGRSPPVIHRDINPKNVVRRPDGSFAVVDFGAVRDRLKPEGGSTVVGTFGYMAPEQFQGRALPASDVYAVGATALRLLTGVEPEELPHKGLAIDVGAALGSNRDPALARVLQRMLDPDPDRRASRVAPLLAELERRSTGPSAASSKERRRDTSSSSTAEERRARQAREAREEQEARERRKARGVYDDWPPPFDQADDWWQGSRKERRRRASEERKSARREMRRHRRGRHGPPIGLFVFGLNIAIVAVWLALGFAVPTLLLFLSMFFGRGLRDAAHRVRAAGERARATMREAERFWLEGSWKHAGVDPGDAAGVVEEPRVEEPVVIEPADARRVEEAPRPRIRLDAEPAPPPSDVIDVEGVETTKDPTLRRS